MHNGNTSASLTIVKPEVVDDPEGSEEATLIGDLAASGLAIIYKKGNTVLDKAPTKKGVYTANVRIGDVEASLEYEITKAVITHAEFELEQYWSHYDGQEKTVKVKNVMFDDTELIEGEDFTVCILEGDEVKDGGTYTIYLKGKGDYSGKTEMLRQYRVLRKDSTISLLEMNQLMDYDPRAGYMYHIFPECKFTREEGDYPYTVKYSLLQAGYVNDGKFYNCPAYFVFDEENGNLCMKSEIETVFNIYDDWTFTYLIHISGNEEYAPKDILKTISIHR